MQTAPPQTTEEVTVKLEPLDEDVPAFSDTWAETEIDHAILDRYEQTLRVVLAFYKDERPYQEIAYIVARECLTVSAACVLHRDERLGCDSCLMTATLLGGPKGTA